MIAIIRYPIAELRKAARERQWWKLGIPLAVLSAWLGVELAHDLRANGSRPAANGIFFLIPLMGVALLIVSSVALVAASFWKHVRRQQGREGGGKDS